MLSPWRRVGHKKAENIETLFQLYDRLEAACQDTARLGRTAGSKEAAAAAQLLDELRQRFVRLVSKFASQLPRPCGAPLHGCGHGLTVASTRG